LPEAPAAAAALAAAAILAPLALPGGGTLCDGASQLAMLQDCTC